MVDFRKAFAEKLNEFVIPFERLSIERSGTKPIAERGTYTEEL